MGHDYMKIATKMNKYVNLVEKKAKLLATEKEKPRKETWSPQKVTLFNEGVMTLGKDVPRLVQLTGKSTRVVKYRIEQILKRVEKGEATEKERELSAKLA